MSRKHRGVVGGAGVLGSEKAHAGSLPKRGGDAGGDGAAKRPRAVAESCRGGVASSSRSASPASSSFVPHAALTPSTPRTRGLGFFSLLPDETVMEVLSQLPPPLVARLSASSRALRCFCDAPELWKAFVLEGLSGRLWRYRGGWKRTWVGEVMRGGADEREQGTARAVDVETEQGEEKAEGDAAGGSAATSVALSSPASSAREPFSSAPSLSFPPGFHSELLYRSWLCARMPIDPAWLEAETVPRRSGLTPEEFRREYEEPNLPVVLTDVVTKWPAFDPAMEWKDEDSEEEEEEEEEEEDEESEEEEEEEKKEEETEGGVEKRPASGGPGPLLSGAGRGKKGARMATASTLNEAAPASTAPPTPSPPTPSPAPSPHLWTRAHLSQALGARTVLVGDAPMRFDDYMRYADDQQDELPLYLFDKNFAGPWRGEEEEEEIEEEQVEGKGEGMCHQPSVPALAPTEAKQERQSSSISASAFAGAKREQQSSSDPASAPASPSPSPPLSSSPPPPSLGREYFPPPQLSRDAFALLPASQRPDFRWLIVGPQHSGSTFHVDPNETCAWNGVVRGSKRWILYPPGSVPPGVRPGHHGADVASPVSVLEWYSSFYDSKNESRLPPVECTQRAGDVVFVPRGWWHQALNLEDDTIAVTQNYAPPSALPHVLAFLATRNPDLVSGVEGEDNRKHLYDRLVAALERNDPKLLRKAQAVVQGWKDKREQEHNLAALFHKPEHDGPGRERKCKDKNEGTGKQRANHASNKDVKASNATNADTANATADSSTTASASPAGGFTFGFAGPAAGGAFAGAFASAAEETGDEQDFDTNAAPKGAFAGAFGGTFGGAFTQKGDQAVNAPATGFTFAFHQ